MTTGPRGPATRGHFRSPWVLLVALVPLQFLWLAWFLFEPLPNAMNAGGAVQHWVFAARAVPHVIPGVTLDQSYLGLALGELSHVGNLPQRVPIVLAAGLIAAGAIGLGGLVLRGLRLTKVLSAWERLALGYVVGASLLGVAALMLGRLGLLGPWTARAGLGLLALAEGIGLVRERAAAKAAKTPAAEPPAHLWPYVALALVVGPFLVTMALGAMLPTIDFDAIEYHLQGPKEYFQAGRIGFLPHNVYTSMPFGVEMLHLLGMDVLNDWWRGALAGQLVVAGFAPAAAVMVAGTAARWGSPRAGWWASAVYLTTPWVYRLGVLPYVEGPLCAYHAALFWAAARAWTEDRRGTRRRLWALAGLVAGGAMACKYPALVSAVLPFGAVALVDALRRRSPSAVLAYSLGWAVVMTPWLGKNVADTGNPVYPLGYHVFGGRHWDESLDRKWSNAHGTKPVTADLLRESVVDVAGRSDWQSPLYVALAPLAFLRRGSRRLAVVLACYVAYLFMSWWLLTHRLDRFWLPLLPALAALAGLGADWTRALGWRVLLGLVAFVAVLTNLSYTSTALTGLNEWTADLGELRTRVPRMLNPPLAALDATLPRDAKVLLVGQAAVFHLDRPIVYNTVFNRETFETLAAGKPPEAVRDALDAVGASYVYVDWHEIDRYRSPGNYGFTDFVRPGVFDRLVEAGVLAKPEALGKEQELYRVIPRR